MNNLHTIEYHPQAADEAVWSVISPEGTCVWRTDDHDEAITERDRRNAPLVSTIEEATA